MRWPLGIAVALLVVVAVNAALWYAAAAQPLQIDPEYRAGDR
jgi:hypothetical protein